MQRNERSGFNGYRPLMHDVVLPDTLVRLKPLLERTVNTAGQDGRYQLMTQLMREMGPPHDSTLRYPDTLPTRIDHLLLSHKPLLGQPNTHLVVVDKEILGKDVAHGFAIQTDALLELQTDLLGDLRYSRQYYEALKQQLWD